MTTTPPTDPFAAFAAAMAPTKSALESEAHWAKDGARYAEPVTYNDGRKWLVLVWPADRPSFAMEPDEARDFAEDLLAAANEAEEKES